MAKFSILKRKLIPPEEVAGIDVTSSAMRLVLLEPTTLNVVTAAEVPLPAGTIAEGRIKSFANFIAVLRALKSRAGAIFRHHPVTILSLAPSVFFTHVLSLPDIPEESFEEAARLNAAQLSPVRLEEAYFDWQNLGVNLETYERELFIAIAARDTVDPYLDCARRAGIDIVAVEPSALGLMRLLTYYVTAEDKRAAFLLVNISSDGMDFVIAKEGKPFFTYFTVWQDFPETRGGRVTLEGLRNVMRRGIAKVSSFYLTRYKNALSNAALFTPVFPEELGAMLRDEFRMKVAGYRFPAFRNTTLPEAWAGALGAALRGVIPRGEDTIVSLMPVGTEALFRERQTASFASFWGKTVAATLALSLAVFGGMFALATNTRNNLLQTLAVQRRSENVVAAEALSARAKEFNDLVEKARAAQGLERIGADELKLLFDMAGAAVTLNSISLQFDARFVGIRASARDRAAALAFKNKFDASGKFAAVDFPIASIVQTPSGVDFILNATFK